MAQIKTERTDKSFTLSAPCECGCGQRFELSAMTDAMCEVGGRMVRFDTLLAMIGKAIAHEAEENNRERFQMYTKHREDGLKIRQLGYYYDMHGDLRPDGTM